MQKTNELIRYFYKHHFVRYLFVGGSTFIIDLGLLIFLHSKARLGLSIATTISYWISVVYNFSLNRWWTFSASENSSLSKHLSTYSVLLAFNYLFTVIFVSLASHSINYALAKVIAVMFQMCWNYFIYKNVIFTKNSSIHTTYL